MTLLSERLATAVAWAWILAFLQPLSLKSALAGPYDPPGLTVLPQSQQQDPPVRPKAVPSSVDGSASSASEDVQELLKLREAQAQSMKSLNEMNPLSQSAQSNEGQEMLPPDQWAKMKLQGMPPQVQALLSSQAGQALVQFASQPAVTSSIRGMMEHPDRVKFLYFEAGWAILLFPVGFWRASRAERWYGKVWVKISNAGIYWGGAVALIPWIVFGDPYAKFFSLVFQAIKP